MVTGKIILATKWSLTIFLSRAVVVLLSVKAVVSLCFQICQDYTWLIFLRSYLQLQGLLMSVTKIKSKFLERNLVVGSTASEMQLWHTFSTDELL